MTLFRFHWPVPCRFRVESKGIKNGSTLEARYTVAVSDAKEKDALEVRFEDAEIIGVSSEKAQLSEPERALIVATMRAIPAFWVSREGKFLDVIDLEGTVRSVLAILQDYLTTQSGLPAEAVEMIASSMLSPQSQEAIRRMASGDIWVVWAGLWSGLTLPVGEEVTLPGALPLPDGSLVLAPCVYRNSGPDASGRCRLSMEQVVEGEEARAAVERALRQSSRELSQYPGHLIERFHQSVRFSVLTHPNTLQPLEASSQKHSETTFFGGEQNAQSESHQYRFEWSV